MKTLESTLATGKSITIEMFTGSESNYPNMTEPCARVKKADGKYDGYGIELDTEILEEESIEEQCLFNLSSFTKEERKEIAKIIEDNITEKTKPERIEVTIPEIRFEYNKNAGSVNDPKFFKQGTFCGNPFAEETSEEGKWKIIFKHPDTGEFYEDTYAWTNTHPTEINNSDRDIIRNQLDNI